VNIHVVDDYEAVSAAAAAWFAARLREKPDSAAVLAMGNTPMGMYAQIADMVKRRELDVSRMKAFQLDGYVGVSPDDPRSLEGWLRRSVVTPWGLRPDQVVRLPEDGRDPEGACRAYEAAVRAASISSCSGSAPTGISVITSRPRRRMRRRAS
jgi:glucosamine-6-phosphate deaminase